MCRVLLTSFRKGRFCSLAVICLICFSVRRAPFVAQWYKGKTVNAVYPDRSQRSKCCSFGHGPRGSRHNVGCERTRRIGPQCPFCAFLCIGAGLSSHELEESTQRSAQAQGLSKVDTKVGWKFCRCESDESSKLYVLGILLLREALPGFLALVRRVPGLIRGSSPRHLKSESTQRSTEFKRLESRHKGRLRSPILCLLCTVAGNLLSA